MAKLTRSHSKSALAEGNVNFTAGDGRFSVSVSSQESDMRYHLHHSETEAQQFAAFLAEHVEIAGYQTMG